MLWSKRQSKQKTNNHIGGTHMGKAEELMEAMENPTGKLYGGARVWFDTITERNEQKSDEEGRIVYDYIEAIYIQHPGDSAAHVKKAKPRDIAAYQSEYNTYKNGEAAPPVQGTPLIEWSMIPRSLVRQFESNGIYTLEQLADLPVNYGHVYARLGPAQEWCGKAKDEMERAAKRATVTKARAENKALEAEVAALRHQVQQLSQRLEAEQGVKYGSEPIATGDVS
jgi:hypothetical protein